MGAIELPETCSYAMVTGKVLRTGPGPTNEDGYEIPMQVQEGDNVILREYHSVKFPWDESNVRFVTGDFIDAVIKPRAVVEPVGDRICIKSFIPVVTSGVIVTPSTVIHTHYEAVVHAVGPGRITSKGTYRPLDVVPGDTLVFERYSGLPLELEGFKFLIIRPHDVMVKK